MVMNRKGRIGSRVAFFPTQIFVLDILECSLIHVFFLAEIEKCFRGLSVLCTKIVFVAFFHSASNSNASLIKNEISSIISEIRGKII